MPGPPDEALMRDHRWIGLTTALVNGDWDAYDALEADIPPEDRLFVIKSVTLALAGFIGMHCELTQVMSPVEFMRDAAAGFHAVYPEDGS